MPPFFAAVIIFVSCLGCQISLRLACTITSPGFKPVVDNFTFSVNQGDNDAHRVLARREALAHFFSNGGNGNAYIRIISERPCGDFPRRWTLTRLQIQLNCAAISFHRYRNSLTRFGFKTAFNSASKLLILMRLNSMIKSPRRKTTMAPASPMATFLTRTPFWSI